MAVGCLLKDIQERLQAHGNKYVIFIDYTKMFNMVNRRKLIGKLEILTGYSDMMNLIANILASNQVQISDGISQSGWIDQTIGVLQGDPLSSLLFNVLTHDVSAKIKGVKNLNVCTYADDMVLAADNISGMQKEMGVITQWAEDNELKINLKNTEVMVFTRGGRLPKEDYIVCVGHILTPKRQVTYLGISLQVSGTTFSVNIKEILAAAIRSISDIRHLHRMPLETAMKLLRTKLTYGLGEILEFISVRQMQDLESLKLMYQKRVLGVSKFAVS